MNRVNIADILTLVELNIKGVSSILSSMQLASTTEQDDDIYAPERFFLLENVLFEVIKDLSKVKREMAS